MIKVRCLLAAMILVPRMAAQSAGDTLPPLHPYAGEALRAVRSQPDDARHSIDRLLALAPSASAARTRSYLDSAEQVANAFAAVWHDSMPLRTITQFRSWPRSQQTLKVTADSMRRAGNAALGQSGVVAALKEWKASLRLASTIADTGTIVAALTNIGAGFYSAGEFDTAVVYLQHAHRLSATIRDWRAAGTALGTLGSIRKDQGDLRQAIDLYHEASRLRERAGDTRGLASDQNNLGLIAASLGDTTQARRRYESALALNRRYGRPEAAAANLINIANLAINSGAYANASGLYRSALATYRKTGNRQDAALTLQNIGRLEIRRGKYRLAQVALDEALTTFEQIGANSQVVSVRLDLATVLGEMGQLQEAIRYTRLAEREAAGPRLADGTEAGVALTSAELHSRLNMLPEADRDYARAERLFRRAANLGGQAAAQLGRGWLALVRNDYAAAEQVLTSARQAQELEGDPREVARTDLLLGYAAERKGETHRARQSYLAALNTFERLRDPSGQANALGTLAGLALAEGLPLTAESLYIRGLGLSNGQGSGTLSWWLHAGRGHALRAHGALTESAAELRSAVRDVERYASTLQLAERRAGFLEDKLQPYADLASVSLELGRIREAFEVSEQLRARQMLDLLAHGRLGEADGLPHGSEEQDLRRRITELTLRLEDAESTSTSFRELSGQATSLDAAREALLRAQEQYSELLVKLREDQPELATLVAGNIATSREVSGSLPSNTAFVEYLVTDSGSVAFVITRDTIVAVDLNVGRLALARLVDFTRGTLGRGDLGRGLWRAPLRRLHQQLVAPVDKTGLLLGKRRLIIAPHGELHYLPFAALLEPGPTERFLIERYDLTYVPSASVWMRLNERRAPSATRTVLALAPQALRLPGARAEVASLRDLYGDEATVLHGTSASESRFRELAPRYDVLHLATYGVLNKQNPMFSFVALQPDSSGDGRLEVQEIFGLRLRARLVVLSACQTALGSGALRDVPEGDDWVGLVRAFLFAGSSAVLATMWPVEDRGTAAFMEDFYRNLWGGTPEPEALGTAQRNAIRKGNKDPFYWAGYSLVGR